MTDARFEFEGRSLLGLLAPALALALLVPGLHAQVEVDSRWLPWVGCWEVVGDGPGAESRVVCVEPVEGDPSAVQLLSDVEGAEEERLWSDGQERTISQAGCEGSQRSYFSADGHRLYVQGTYVCDDGAVQEGRGVIAMISDDEWVDIRSLSQGDETVVMAQRYVQATPAAIRAAGRVELTSPRTLLSRRLAAGAPDVETLQEVHSEVGERATMAWLMETGQALDLDADDLVALADAGVEPDVIDMAIAVSYPDDFRVAPGQGMQVAQMENGPVRPGNASWYRPFGARVGWGGGFWGPMFSPWGGFGLNSWFYNGWNAFSPFGGWGGGWGGPGGWFGPGPVIIRRGSGTADGGGRAIPGRGYRSGNRGGAPAAGRARTPRPSPRMNPPRSAAPRSGSARPSARSGGSSTRGATSTGRRTAKPRRAGGGG